MNSDSQIIAGTFYELRRFCRDVKLLLSTAEEIFAQREWLTAQGDKTCVSNNSSSLDHPDGWLPIRFYRSYRSAKHPGALAYIAVIIDLPPGRETDDGNALLTAGVLWSSEPEGWVSAPSGFPTRIYTWHCHRADRDDTGKPAWHDSPFQWEQSRLPNNWKNVEAKVHRAITLARPLHEITSTDQLEAEVIDQLLGRI
jgi:hypothetical protein